MTSPGRLLSARGSRYGLFSRAMAQPPIYSSTHRETHPLAGPIADSVSAHRSPTLQCNSAVWRALKDIKREHNTWKHIAGQETRAVDTILRIEEESRVARELKAAAGHK